MQDLFQKPNPFAKDIAVVIFEVVYLKIGTLSAHQLQMFEWLPWTRGVQEIEIPKGEEGRLSWLKDRYTEDGNFDEEAKMPFNNGILTLDIENADHVEML